MSIFGISNNPISSPFSSIRLVSGITAAEGEEDKSIELIASNDPTKNLYCQFERLETEESVNTLFPLGTIIVRDLGDIVSYIAQNQINSISVVLGSREEKYTWFITSVSYVNNVASEMDQSFVAIYFTNNLFKESQLNSFYTERPSESDPSDPVPLIFSIKYPFITTHKHLVSAYGYKNVFSPALSLGTDTEGESTSLKGCGVNVFIKNTQEPVNYVLHRPRISDSVRREQFQTNIISYLNYLFTYAVNEDGNPFYLFWTDFIGSLNYKYFDLEKDLNISEAYSIDYPDTNPGQIQVYSIYDSPDQFRPINLDEDTEVLAKKIYVLVTNPAYSYNKKNYYYLRNNPIYMEQRYGLAQGVTSSYLNLMSPFLSESANTILTTVTSYTISTSPASPTAVWNPNDKNLVFLPDNGYSGYTKDANSDSKKINSVDALSSYENFKNHYDSSPAGLRDLNDTSEDFLSPVVPFNDNEYMWQFQYDLTSTHPNIGLTGGVSTTEQQSESTGGGEGGGGGSTEQSVTTETPVTVENPDFYKEIETILNTSLSGENTSFPDSQLFEILKNVKMNKVLQAKYEAQQIDGGTYDNEKREELEQIEKENFVSNVLCCMGEELMPDPWFFAVITGYVKDKRQIVKSVPQTGDETWITSLDDAWLYSWKKLETGPVIANMLGVTGSTGFNCFPGGSAANAGYQTMFNAWKLSECYGSTGLIDLNTVITDLESGKGFDGLDTWAVNINERFNRFAGFSGTVENNPTGVTYRGITAALADYLGPGYNEKNITASRTFSYRPVGFTGQFYAGDTAGSAFHIVQMHRMSVNKLRAMGCAVAAPEMSDYNIYYFNVENVIDGAC